MALPFPLWISYGAGNPSHQDIDDCVAAGAEGIRTSIVWDKYDPNHGGRITASTNQIDGLIQYCNQKGLLVDLQIGIGPTFGAGGGGTGSTKFGQGFNEHAPGQNGTFNVPRLLSMFAVDVVAHFAPVGANYPNGRLYMCELGNEPNHQKWDAPEKGSGITADQKGRAYLKMMARWYPPAKAANPGVILIPGGLGGHRDDENDVTPSTFLAQMYDATLTPAQGYDGYGAPNGVQGLFDAWNTHPYQDMTNWPAGNGGWSDMDQDVVPLLAAHGEDTKGIVITEFGESCTTAAEKQHASASLTKACQVWGQASYGGAIGMPFMLFALQDSFHEDKPGRTNFGIIEDDPSRARKQPYWDTFHDLATSVTPPTNPTVTSLSPSSGTTAGGTTVTVTGTNFTGATAVKFGATSASFSVTNATTISATSPAGTGAVNVKVTTPAGTSVQSVTYTYTGASNPTVTSISPTSGVASGGTTVTVTGTNLSGTTAVKFGARAGTSVTNISGTSVSARSPAGTGVVNVTVTTATGTSVQSVSYTYLPVGPTAGGIGICVSDGGNQTTIANRVKDVWDDAGNTDDRLVRRDVNWSGVQSFSPLGTAGQNDSFIWGGTDTAVDAHEAAGNKMLLVLGIDTPGPLRGGANNGHVYPSRDAANGYRDYANFCWAVVNRYCGPGGRNPDTVVAVELWNEPNGGFGLNPVSAANYWSMYICAARAIKTGAIAGRATREAFDSSVVQVISAGCQPVQPGTANATDRWVKSGIDAGTGPYLDGAATHPYGLQCPPDRNVWWNQRKFVLPQLRTVLNNAGLSTVGIWITEDGCFTRLDNTPTDPTGDDCGTLGTGTGDASHEVTESTAAIRIGQLIDGPTSWFWANKQALGLVWLTYYQDADTGTVWSNHAGLHYQNGTPKTAVRAAFVAALSSGPPTRNPPTASISAPPNDPTHTNPVSGQVVFICPSTDEVDEQTDLVVKLYRNSGSTLVGTCDWAQFGHFYLLDSTTLGDANYAFVTKVTNTAGLTTTSSVVNVTVDNNVGPGIPAVTSVENNATGLPSGVVAGGDAITIGGSNFTGSTLVKMGATNMTSFTVVSDSVITAVTPAKTAGTYDVRVTNPSGTSPIVNGDRFTYTSTTTPGAPTVTAVSPASGDVAGGTLVSITGTNFTGVTSVKFGATNATSYTVNSTTSIGAVAPAGSAGAVDVTVTNATGTSGISTADVYRYTVTVPRTPPAAAVFSLTASDGTVYLAPGATPILVVGTITVEATATDSVDTSLLPDLYAGSLELADKVGTMTPKPGVANHYVLTFDTHREPNSVVQELIVSATNSAGQTGTSQ